MVEVATSPPSSKRKLLVCHDIMAGIEQESSPYRVFLQGTYHSRLYRFTPWQFTDIYVHFGHERLMIPPPALIKIGHSYGVKMLGTLVFEWEKG
jgi:endo-beta-N-acetylglucosaminidase D